MKKLIPILAVLLLGLWIGCGDDELNGPDEPTAVRVIANTTVSAPTLSSADEQVWVGVDSFRVEVSQANSPKLRPPEAAAVPPDIYVQAIKKADNLYLRLQWSDLTFDAYPDHFFVVDNIGQIEFGQDTILAQEDQIYVMFDSLPEGGYDVWAWRVLTTGGGKLGKGYTYNNATLTPDAAGTASDSETVKNIRVFHLPTYAHKDTSDFGSELGHYILYTTDSLKYTDTLYINIDTVIFGDPPDTTIDTTAITFPLTTGWELDQKVPGWLIDSSFASRTDEVRGSRWDIKAVSIYDDDAAQYRVVLCRELNTGFSVDEDIDLSAMDSVKVKIGIYDNQDKFEEASSRRGFSDDFWIILK
ncbi:MAG: hypothetical protein KAT58_00035 [candidate division Zixibacteria bacterium]|nr:hypothetical protein [candidate division Zixibacteria bacterium]